MAPAPPWKSSTWLKWWIVKPDLSGWNPDSTASHQNSDVRLLSHHHPLRAFLVFRSHVLRNVYTVEDLSKQIGKKLPTLNPNVFWEVSNSSRVRNGQSILALYT